MTDWVFDSTDQTTLYDLAHTMGYWDIDNNKPLWSGQLPDGSGDYFLNEVGLVYQAAGNTVAPIPGYWSRLRINGNDPFADGTLEVPTNIIIYPPVKYLADGVTPDPAYTQPPIGVIA